MKTKISTKVKGLFLATACLFTFNTIMAQTLCADGADVISTSGGTYSVPADAAEVTISLTGADGGDNVLVGKLGGAGAKVTATFPVCSTCTIKPGSTIKFYYGGPGETSNDSGGAGGGGASVALVDGTAYPLLIASGGGGASETDGEGGNGFTVLTAQPGAGGSLNIGGGGGGGAGATDTVLLGAGTINNGQPATGDFDPVVFGLGGGPLPEILTGTGGSGGADTFDNGGVEFGYGHNGGLGGGGAGGNGNSEINYGGGGGGAGYRGGAGGFGQYGGFGGHCYVYPESFADLNIVVDGANGGGTQSGGSGAICYKTTSDLISCTANRGLLNGTFSDFGNVSVDDIYVDDASICSATWEYNSSVTGAWQNTSGNTDGALCTSLQYNPDGLVTQTIDNANLATYMQGLCKGQAVEVCFELNPTWLGNSDIDIKVMFGGLEYLHIYENVLGEERWSLGADADSAIYGFGDVQVDEETGDIPSTINKQICIKDNNYDGTIASAKLEFIITETKGTDHDILNFDNIIVNVSQIGAPIPADAADLVVDPSRCVDMFDLTALVESPSPSLNLVYKDSAGNLVPDPTAVVSGTYTICYVKPMNELCGGDCLDEVCEDVSVTCGPDTDRDGVPDYLDLDSDNDGISDAIEGVTDTDSDGILDYLDLDSDNDGINDIEEVTGIIDADGDGMVDDIAANDADRDGLHDSFDNETISGANAATEVVTGVPVIIKDEDGTVGADYTTIAADGINPELTGNDTDGDGVLDLFDGENGFGDAFISDASDAHPSFPIVFANQTADLNGDSKPDGFGRVWAGNKVTYESAPVANDIGDDGLLIVTKPYDYEPVRTAIWSVDLNASSDNTEVFYQLNIDWGALYSGYDVYYKGSAIVEKANTPVKVNIEVDIPPYVMSYDSGYHSVRLVVASNAEDAKTGSMGAIEFSRAGLESFDNGEVEDYALSPISIIPVELIDFNAKPKGTNAQLTWSTATENNNSHFNVQRSLDGVNFKTVGKVQGAGTTNEQQTYSYVDSGIALEGNEFYYRLEQVDFDGTTDITDIRLVAFSGVVGQKIFPNPAFIGQNVSIQSKNMNIVELFNAAGELVATIHLNGQNATSFNTSNLAKGVYVVVINNGESTQKLVIQ